MPDEVEDEENLAEALPANIKAKFIPILEAGPFNSWFYYAVLNFLD